MQSDAQSLGSVLRSLLRERGLNDITLEARVPHVWNELVGENASKHCTSVAMQSRVLHVQVDSSVWRSELRLRKDDLRRRINEQLGSNIVDDIQLR
ncbi:MAG: DciA family protein [Candidatus Kapaibacterium sp.]|jgi:predicted nucleic acid-binding Zn ribbon protein